MSIHESDISWQVLRRIVQQWAGTSAELAEVKPLVGGMINTTLCLTLSDGQRVVLKISPHRVNRDYEREAHQLNLLRSLGIPTPRVYQLETGSLEDPHSLILMEYIDGVDLSEARRQCSAEQFDQLQQHLAEILRTMHAQTAGAYQRVLPGEDVRTFSNWPEFYRHLYDPIVHEVQKNPELGPRARKQIQKVHEKLDRLIAHSDSPRLVHWDVWSTNLLARPDASGRWRICAVLDPNCKYAHAEAEIAYIDLFNTCNHAFLKAYQQPGNRLDDSYHRMRKPVYQLYPLIHHVNLFGREYIKPMLAALDRVAGLL
ncbi:MAG TPA: fructosamine kinase family protein [Tepidisphaeraceae bacterium]|nr:fructosamine kinase family protein [Tepidisphaeraceae bacterium]